MCSRFLLFLVSFIICLAYLASSGEALECLLCKSSDLDSECRSGQRKFRPKVSHCYAPTAKCYAMTQIDANGQAIIRRGCTIHEDFCQTQSNDVEYCKTCGSKLCNFWIMDIGGVAENLARSAKEVSEKEQREQTNANQNSSVGIKGQENLKRTKI